MKLSHYPNLEAVLEGRVSGQATEWPTVRAELVRVLERLDLSDAEIADLRAKLAKAEQWADELSSVLELRGDEIIDLRAKLAGVEAALSTMHEGCIPLDQWNKLKAKLAASEKDNADFDEYIDGLISDREYFEAKLAAAEQRAEAAEGLLAVLQAQVREQNAKLAEAEATIAQREVSYDASWQTWCERRRELEAKLFEAQKKLAWAGVEGSPAPGQQGVIPELKAKLADAENRLRIALMDMPVDEVEDHFRDLEAKLAAAEQRAREPR